MKYSTSKPEDMPSEEYWADKSQDTEWLRGGFLARGAELDDGYNQIARLTKTVSVYEIELARAKLHKAWYRAAFGLSFGALLVNLLT